jgi:hypothetical protein
MTVDLTKLSFISTLNYLKRDSALVGSDTITLGSSGSVSTKVVTHNLGYIPFFQVGADIVNDGMIWSNDIVNLYTQTSLSGTSTVYPTLMYWVTTTDLTIAFYNNTSPLQTGTRTVYWAIYLDYDS